MNARFLDFQKEMPIYDLKFFADCRRLPRRKKWIKIKKE